VILDTIFKLNLILLSLDHLITGGLGLFFPAIALRFYRKVFGINVPVTTAHLFIVKPWGALGIFAGLIGLLPVYDQSRYSAILYGLVVLLCLRVYMRISSARMAESQMQLSRKRNMFHVALIITAGVIICVQILTGS
jgi:hypothetical protein